MTYVDRATLAANFDHRVTEIQGSFFTRRISIEMSPDNTFVYCDSCGYSESALAERKGLGESLGSRLPAGWEKVGMAHLCPACASDTRDSRDGGHAHVR